MKQLKFARSNGPVDERIVAKFELNIGNPLPTEYRAFIKETNGGRIHVENSYVLFADENHPAGMKGMGINYFYNLVNPETPVLELTSEFLAFRGRIPDETISIGKDGMGNLVLLQVSGETIGYVHCWDHESEGCGERGDPWGNVYFLASSFGELCGRLVRNPYED